MNFSKYADRRIPESKTRWKPHNPQSEAQKHKEKRNRNGKIDSDPK